MAKTFKALCCDYFGCAPERYERSVFWRCLHRRAMPLSALLYWLNANFFTRDFALIRQLGLVTGQREFQRELDNFAYEMKSYGNLLQRRFRVRLSGQRLMNLSGLVRLASA